MSTAVEIVNDLERRRKSLRISKSALAKRAGVSLPTVQRVLSGRDGNATLHSLLAIGNALGAEIEVRAEGGTQELRRAEARKKAERLARLVQGNMALESQAVDSGTLIEIVEQFENELLAGPQRRLWSD